MSKDREAGAKKAPPPSSSKKSKNEVNEQEPSQTDKILKIGELLTFFCDEREETFAVVPVKDHSEIYNLKSKKFEHWITYKYYRKTGKTFGSEAFAKALGVFTAYALLEGKQRKIYKRCAYKNGALYYYLNNKSKEIVKITPNDWKIIPRANNVVFYCNKLTKAQAIPVKCDIDLELIYKHYRFKRNSDKILHFVSLVTKFIPTLQHAINVVYGEKGSSKSTTLRKDRLLIDPSECDLLVLPTKPEELAIQLNNHYFPCYDNISKITPAISNLLCMAVTGGTYSKRMLYADYDEVLLKFCQPVSLNGINVVATQPDLLDRCVLLELERIPPNEQKTERELWSEFEKDKPPILGMIFTILSKALKIEPTITLKEHARLADFTHYGYAIAEAAGIGGEKFLKALMQNQSRVNDEAIQSNPIAEAIIHLMKHRPYWKGSGSELLHELNEIAEKTGVDTRDNGWVNQPNILSRRLRVSSNPILNKQE